MGIDVDGETAGENSISDLENRDPKLATSGGIADAESLVVAPVEERPQEAPKQTTAGKENAEADAHAAADHPAISLDSLIEIALRNLDGD